MKGRTEMRRIAVIAAGILAATTMGVLAEEVPIPGEELTGVASSFCMNAIEEGKILTSDGDLVRIYYSFHLYLIRFTGDQMSCRVFRLYG